MKSYEIPIGSIFGEWTVIGISPQKDQWGSKLWECRCSCGAIKYIPTGNLINEKSLSCGHSKKIDFTGRKFGKLIVIKKIPSNKITTRYLCKCECGSERIIDAARLASGRSTRCMSCAQREISIRRTHGMSRSAEYSIWINMRKRCLNPNTIGWKNYGGRGIRVCKRWLHSFENFLADMGKRPSKNHSIDRIKNNGNYEPSNCRWATKAEQNHNRRPMTVKRRLAV